MNSEVVKSVSRLAVNQLLPVQIVPSEPKNTQAASWVSLMDQHEEITEETRQVIRGHAHEFLKRCGWTRA